MIKKLLGLEKALVVLLVFLIPTQLALHFWPEWAFVFGIRIDYLSPSIYLTDILVVALLVFGFRSILKYKKYLFFLILLSLVNICFSTSPIISFFKWLKILEFVALAVYVSNRLKIIGKEIILKTLFYSAIFFSVVGISQFLLGHTLNGVFYWLGERSFNISTPGIALTEIGGQDFLRAYSTFPHPNALAGYLGVGTIFLFVNNFFKKNRKRFCGLLIILTCFLLTFSLTAFLAIVSVAILRKNTSKFFIPVVLASLLMPVASLKLMPYINFKNILERLDLAVISGSIISHNFWTGTGLNTFVINSSSWLLQPVHNIFLLTLSEVGILGLLVLIFFLRKSLRIFPLAFMSPVFMFIIITGFFDHYWLDAQQNLLLLSLISGTLTAWKKRV